MALPAETLRLGRDIPFRRHGEPYYPERLRDLDPTGSESKTTTWPKRSRTSLSSSPASTARSEMGGGRQLMIGGAGTQRMRWAVTLFRSRQTDVTLFWPPYSRSDQQRIVDGELPLRAADQRARGARSHRRVGFTEGIRRLMARNVIPDKALQMLGASEISIPTEAVGCGSVSPATARLDAIIEDVRTRGLDELANAYHADAGLVVAAARLVPTDDVDAEKVMRARELFADHRARDRQRPAACGAPASLRSRCRFAGARRHPPVAVEPPSADPRHRPVPDHDHVSGTR